MAHTLALICLVLSISLSLTLTQSCSKRSDCSSVTDNLAYVGCSKGKCVCLTWNGFVGAANRTSKCKCPFSIFPSKKNGLYCKDCQKPRGVINDADGIPRCVNLPECENYNQQISYQERNKLVVKRVYDYIIYPMPQKIINDFVNNRGIPDMFMPNVRGRINPFGEFASDKGIVEYFYGVPVASQTDVVKIHYLNLVAEKNEVFFRIDIQYRTLSGRPRDGNLTHIGRFAFNKQSRVTSFEFTNMNLGILLDEWVSLEKKLQVVCYVAKMFCNGTNLQYNSDAECVSYLQAVPEGSWNRGNSNSTVCRYLHSHLAAIDPDNHCTHIGPSGGGKCIDFPYEYYYKNQY